MAWSIVGNIRGPQGAAGTNGTNGADSASGYPPNAAGFKMWTIDPGTLQAEYNSNNGVLLMQRVQFPRAETISNLHACVTAFGDGSSTGRNGMALYDDTGALLSKSTDVIATLQSGSAGARTFPLVTPQAVTAGMNAWMAILYNSTGAAPKIASTTANLLEAVLNLGARRAVYLTGQSDFPSSVTISSANLNNGVHWMAAT